MQLLTLIIVFAVALGFCVLGLALNILLRKNGKFPETEVGRNKNMRKLGITCTKQEEMRHWKKTQRKKDRPVADCSDCTACRL